MNTADPGFVVTAFLTLLTATGALWAAWATHRYARTALRESRAVLLSQLLAEYASDEMLVAMNQLGEFQRSHPSEFADMYGQLRKTMDIQGQRYDGYRRRVSHYFNKVRILCETGLIEEELIDKALGVGPAKFLLEVIEPIEEAHSRYVIGGKYDTTTFEYFARRYGLSRQL